MKQNTNPTDDSRLPKFCNGQQLLFPQSGRQFCNVINLNWWAAIKLITDGWLSFNPENAKALDESQEEELRFIGSLINGGCTPDLLEELLRNLERPFSYSGRHIYYDWGQRRWRQLPEPLTDPEHVVTEWLNVLQADGDVDRLEELQIQVEAALESAIVGGAVIRNQNS